MSIRRTSLAGLSAMHRCSPLARGATSVAVIVSLMALSSPVHAGKLCVLNVPADLPTIQEAIDIIEAQNCPTGEIIVAPGTYHEAINFRGQAINLHSSGGSHLTIIDGTGFNISVVSCKSGEGPGTILNGFTITGGHYGTCLGNPCSYFGFGMFILNSSPTVMNCIFTGNGNSYHYQEGPANNYLGAGLSIVTNSGSAVTPTITDCQFTNNTFYVGSQFPNASTYGGGVYVHKSNPTITGCTFSGNTAKDGAGVMQANGAAGRFINCTFTNNTASLTPGDGGGGWCSINSDPDPGGAGGGIVSGCTFTGNSAGLNSNTGGGGMFVTNSSVAISDCTFTGNSGPYGAGIFVNNQSSLNYLSPSITRCTFTGNSSPGDSGPGAGLMLRSANSVVRDCVFQGNTTGSFGGGLCMEHSGASIIANCVLSGNTAGAGGGIALKLGGADTECGIVSSCAVISNCTIVGNNVTATNRGAGIEIVDTDPSFGTAARISGCIVRGNTGASGFSNVRTPTSVYAGWDILRHCNIQGPVVGQYTGSNNIDAAPLFVDADGTDNNPATYGDNNYHLLSGSPCIDTGHHWDLIASAITTDKDGNPRNQDGTGDGTAWADMGAYEFQGIPGTLGTFPLPFAFWHFNALAAHPTGPIAADTGTGSIDLSGWGGTVDNGTSAASCVNGAFANINRVIDTPAGRPLQLLGMAGNNTAIKINFSMTGRSGLKVTFVGGRSFNLNTFSNGTWTWSTDGVIFTAVAGVNTCPSTLFMGRSALQTVDLSTVASLNNAPSVTLKYTLSGATFDAYDIFATIDNLQLNAIPIPLPCVGDVTGNQTVNIDDLVQVITHWASVVPGPWDVNGNGIVNIDDLVQVITHWGSCP